MKKIRYKYSGEDSELFWNMVNSLKRKKRNELYSLGVVLQNIESFVLKRLKEVAPGFVQDKD